MSKPYADREIWFLTGSQDLYGEDTLRQVAEQSATRWPACSTPRTRPGPVVWKPVLTRCDGDPPGDARRQRSTTTCIGAHRLDAHVLPGPDVDRAAWTPLDNPLLHLHTQANVELPWANIDMDFMNLNQAAHGDREFGYALTRMGIPRTTVVGHVSNPGSSRRVGVWVRAAAGWTATRGCDWSGSATTCVTSRSPRATRRDRVHVFGVSVNTWGVNDLVARVDAVADAMSTPRWPSTRTATTWCPSCAAAEGGTSRCATAPGSSSACGPSSATAASGRSRRTSRTSAGCGSCPAWRSSG